MRAAAVVAATTLLIAAGCAPDDETLEGWGPGTPAPIVVTVAPMPDSTVAPAAGGDGEGGDGEGGDGGDVAAPPPSTEPPPPVYAPNGQTVRVRSLDNSFRAEVTEVVVGTEIWWTNDGRNEHDVLPVDGSEEWGMTREGFQPGDEYRHTFLEPGTYEYYCSIHGNEVAGMVGTIIVTAPS